MRHQTRTSRPQTVSLSDVEWLGKEISEVAVQMLSRTKAIPSISDNVSKKMRKLATKGKHQQVVNTAREGVVDVFALFEEQALRIEHATQKVLGEVRRPSESPFAFLLRMIEELGTLEGVLCLIEKNGLRVTE